MTPANDALRDELAALISNTTDSDLTNGGIYFRETCNDLTQCPHGDMGRYQNPDDGKLVEFLWNNRRNFLAALAQPQHSASPEVVEALERNTGPLADAARRIAMFHASDATGQARSYAAAKNALLAALASGSANDGRCELSRV